MDPRNHLTKRAAFALATIGAVGAMGAGCLTRPVEPGTPSLKTNFTTQVRQQSVDKVDLLFMIDNSASMGDKQSLLALAVPDLMSRLVQPNCVDATGKVLGTTADGSCNDSVGGAGPAGGKAEFQPVHDMHIGILSSSLGGRGSDACPAADKNPTNPNLNRHNDDSAHLLNRGGDDEHSVGDAVQDAAGGGFFLAWFPKTDRNTGHANPVIPVTNVGTLGTDFADMVSGVHQYGCGYEAQLESWYRFLIQPDPYKSISAPDGNGQVHLVDVDANILQQRADFLRPDSLVAIIVLTDENHSTVDPLALGGQGWAYEAQSFPGSQTGGGAAKGTTACAQNPNDPNCTSCGFCQNGSPAAICNDPNCGGPNKGYYTVAEDSANERFFRMKQRFGVDPQFPVKRYINGLNSHKVPDRNGEHPPDSKGTPSANYVGQNNCSNPLFSTNLPKDATNGNALCTLTPGPRTPDLIYFAAITGVPWQLLLNDKSKPATSDFKTKFTDADWTAIIGKDPLNYDFSGADPHMIESITPRPGLPAATAADDADPINGREWDTAGSDLQYACTFPLPGGGYDCTDPLHKNACDCEDGKKPPLCDPATPTKQIRGKAYPSIQELSVVRAMGDQGIVSSLCPRTLDTNSPDFGYRPAVRAIIDRLKNALANQCLPQALTGDSSGQVPCLILLTLTNAPSADEAICTQRGFDIPDATILAKFREDQHAVFVASGGGDAGIADPSAFPVCQLRQIVKKPGDSCASDPSPGWCYVQNTGTATPAGTCAQAILFTSSGNPTGAQISLQCIEANTLTEAGTALPPATGSE